MKRRDAMRRLAGAAAGLGAGAVLAGNIEPGRRLYGTPETLRFQRPGEENLLRLALAREEVPTGVWEETCALAQLAARVVEHPGEAQAFGRDPAGAFRSLGYDLSTLRLDEPEVRACLLLAEDEVRSAITAGDAHAFIRALQERGIETDQEKAALVHAFRQALENETALGLRPVPAGGPSGPEMTAGYVVVAFVLAVVVAVVAALVLAAVAVVAYLWVGVSGGGAQGKLPRKGSSLSALALESGNPNLARRVRDTLLDDTADALAAAAVEAASTRGLELSHEEAARQVRATIDRFIY